MERSLLLDFDGVLINNVKMNRLIQHQATKFFSHHTKIPYDMSFKLNNKFYKHYGHTVNFVKDLVPKDVNMLDFNEYVYSPEVLSCASDELTLYDKHKFHEWEAIINAFKSYNYDVKIFSNAPLCWIDICLSNLSVSSDVFDDVICFDNVRSLKPAEQAYHDIYKNEERIIFVDDTKENLYCLLNQPTWIPILYDTEDKYQETLCDTINYPEMLLGYI